MSDRIPLPRIPCKNNGMASSFAQLRGGRAHRRLTAFAYLVGGFCLALLLTSVENSNQRRVLSRLEGSHSDALTIPETPKRTDVTVFVGIQTGFSTNKINPKYNYERRRDALRATWVPATDAARRALFHEHGVVVQFVVGHSHDPEAERLLDEEQARHGGFMRLDMMEDYLELSQKTLLFLRMVLKTYNPKYILKVDDDVYVRPDRLPAAVVQWSSIHADYVGCMKNGNVIKSPRYRWYEPDHAMLGSSYYAHTWGSAYVVSGRAAEVLAGFPVGTLRMLANEDTTLGLWMLALNMTHYDDRRLCSPACTNSSVAVYDYPRCAGLCAPADDLPRLHASPECRTPALGPGGALPMLPSALVFDRSANPTWENKALQQMARARARSAAELARHRSQGD